MCGQTHEFEIHATRQRARAGNSTVCYRKKQIDSGASAREARQRSTMGKKNW